MRLRLKTKVRSAMHNNHLNNLMVLNVYQDEIDKFNIQLYKVNIRLHPSNSIKHLVVRIDRFLHWHYQVNNTAVKLYRANALLLKIRNYGNIKTLRNIYFAILDSDLSYSCIVWAQNVKTARRLIILQKKALRIWNFKEQLFYLSPLFFSNNILKFSDKTKYSFRQQIYQQASALYIL